jgi:hypothetical protein
VREAVGEAVGATTGGGVGDTAAADEAGGDRTGGADVAGGDETADEAADETAGETGAELVDVEWWLLEQPATTSTAAILKRAARAVREMFMLSRRRNDASGCIGVAVTLLVKRVGVGVACIAKTGGNGGAYLAELPYLLGSEGIEQMGPHTLDMPRRSGGKRREAGIGQDGELAASVGRTEFAPDPTVLLESRHGMRQPASRRQ